MARIVPLRRWDHNGGGGEAPVHPTFALDPAVVVG